MMKPLKQLIAILTSFSLFTIPIKYCAIKIMQVMSLQNLNIG